MPILKLSIQIFLCLCFLIAIPVSIHADVLTVGTGGDYAQITDALADAVDGDIILVEPGSYISIVIDNLGVSVIADSGGEVRMMKATVRNLAAHQTVVLSGISCIVQPFPPASKLALTLENNAGTIRCEDCVFKSYGYPSGDRGAVIRYCDDVAFIRSTVRGGGGWPNMPSGGNGGRGVEAVYSTITFYDSLVAGGAGGVEYLMPGCNGGDGGNGLHTDSCFIFASGSEIKGGNGADGALGDFFIDPGDGGNGGHGLVIPFSSEAWLLDNTITAGTGGEGGEDTSGGPPGKDGNDGLEVTGTLSKVHYFAETAHHLEVTSPVREGESMQMTFTGETGNYTLVLYTLDPGNKFFVGLRGMLLVACPPYPFFFYMGQLNAGGLIVQLPVPELGAGIDGLRIHTESYFRYPSGQRVLGTAQTVFLLDSGF